MIVSTNIISMNTSDLLYNLREILKILKCSAIIYIVFIVGNFLCLYFKDKINNRNIKKILNCIEVYNICMYVCISFKNTNHI